MKTKRLDEHTEKQLWNQFRSGDRRAYTQIIEHYIETLFNYGCRLSKDRDFVKDCVQDVFIALWKGHANISEAQSVKWYLFKSLRMRIYRESPKWDRTDQVPEDYHFAIEFNVESQWIKELEIEELSLKVKDVLNALPARQREVIYLRFFEDLEMEEVMDVMQLSRQSVHNLLQKAFKNFRADWSAIYLIVLFRLLDPMN